jgi:ferredoxin-type protein NapF
MDPRRRLFLRGAVRSAAAPQVPAPLRPPWSLPDDELFQARCTRCDACSEACPHGLIQRGDGGYPVPDFRRHSCDLCGRCLAACKTGALSGEAPARRWGVVVGEGCLTRHQVECRSCADACEPRALRFAVAAGGIARLQVDADACNGCTDCVPVCPAGALAMQLPAGG